VQGFRATIQPQRAGRPGEFVSSRTAFLKLGLIALPTTGPLNRLLSCFSCSGIEHHHSCLCR